MNEYDDRQSCLNARNVKTNTDPVPPYGVLSTKFEKKNYIISTSLYPDNFAYLSEKFKNG